MVDVYVKGKAHLPLADVTGHYVGMHAPEQSEFLKPTQLWWRADEYAEAISQRDAWCKKAAELIRARELSAEASATMRDESIAKTEVIKELEERCRLLKNQVTDIIAHVADLDSQLAAATQRRPPKRATPP